MTPKTLSLDLNLRLDGADRGSSATLMIAYRTEPDREITILGSWLELDGHRMCDAPWLLDMHNLNETIHEQLYEHEFGGTAYTSASAA